MNLFKKIQIFPRTLAVLAIRFYQATVSPDHGWFKSLYPYGFCYFYPSCSEYAKQSIINNGLIKGLFYSILRIIKCNPWTHPRVDLVSH